MSRIIIVSTDQLFRSLVGAELVEKGHFVEGVDTLDGIGGRAPGSAEWKAASDRIRMMLILKRIARQEGIEVEEADVNKRIVEKAEEFRTSKDVLQKELVKGGGLERLRDMLLAERTLDYLIEKTEV
jgi:hypothetical protein